METKKARYQDVHHDSKEDFFPNVAKRILLTLLRVGARLK